MKYKRIFIRLLKHPLIFREVYDYLKNDILTSLGVYRYDYKILFVSGLIKSGSSWLGNMLAMIPGYNLRSIVDPDKTTYGHDISESVFSSLPKNKYSVMKLHTRYTEENFRIITKYVPKFVVTYRDLRDTCIARYFYVLADSKNQLHGLYKSLTRNEGIKHSIDTVEKYHAPWVRGWIEVASKNKGMILLIRYEDLNFNTFDTLKRVMAFYDIKVSDSLLHSLANTRIKKPENLEAALKKDLPGKLRSTARKGIVGDWKNYFNDKHKDKFKEIAGELLIRLGYEKDYNW